MVLERSLFESIFFLPKFYQITSFFKTVYQTYTNILLPFYQFINANSPKLLRPGPKEAVKPIIKVLFAIESDASHLFRHQEKKGGWSRNLTVELMESKF